MWLVGLADWCRLVGQLLSVLSAQALDLYSCAGSDYASCVQVGVEIRFAAAGFVSSAAVILLLCWQQYLWRRSREA